MSVIMSLNAYHSMQVGRTTFVELFTAYPDTQLLFRAFHAEDVSTLESSNAALQGTLINDACFEQRLPFGDCLLFSALLHRPCKAAGYTVPTATAPLRGLLQCLPCVARLKEANNHRMADPGFEWKMEKEHSAQNFNKVLKKFEDVIYG